MLKLTVEQAQRLHNAGFKSFGQGRTSTPSRGTIAEAYHWTAGWVEAQGFAERQKVLDEERKKIAEETRYVFLAINDDGVVWVSSGQSVNKPEDIEAWARSNGYIGFVTPVVGPLVGALPAVKHKVKPKIKPKAAK